MPRASALAVLLACSPASAQPTPFQIWRVTHDPAGTPTLEWTAETNGYGALTFTVQGTTSLALPFQDLSAPIPETGPFMFTDTVLGGAPDVFYRVACPTAYTPLTQPGALDAFDAGGTGGLVSMGYAGAVFDGRHVYFVPYQAAGGFHGRVLRYDTWGSFDAPSSYAAYDASGTGGGGAVGFTGGVFDGRFVYFVPQAGPQANVLRYDTTGGFTDAGSWSRHDASATDGLVCRGFQGGVFDGRHVYFVPHYNSVGAGWNGIVLRYDTTAPFAAAASWQAWDAGSTDGLETKGYSGGVFDGRYVYFVPIVDGAGAHGRVLRYDTQGAGFKSFASWAGYDAGTTGGLATRGFKGGVFDGRYVYFAPYTNPSGACNVLRYDTTATFDAPASWSAYPAALTSGIPTSGYYGAVFDGRRVIFVPYQASGIGFHGRILMYDTAGPFAASASWSAVDAGATDGLVTKGYVGAALDGRYVYFAPYREGAPFHGRVLRFDARLPRGIPPTVWGGSTL